MSAPVPAIGTKAVHKEDYAKTQGPVWEVYGHTKQPAATEGGDPVVDGVRLKQADHKLNKETFSLSPKNVPLDEFKNDYRML